MLDELKASCESSRRAWENLEEIRWVLKGTAGVERVKRKTIDLQGRIVEDGVRTVVKDRHLALGNDRIGTPPISRCATVG